MTRKLAVIGAGPKAAALVARAAVLERVLGPGHVPELMIFERDHVASAWSGRGNYSNGFVTLCTPGEKDVGFPYDEATPRRGAGEAIAPLLFARFSWSAYLVATGRFGEWVDRERDHPTHARFAHYIEWIFGQLNRTPVKAEVLRIVPDAGCWRVEYRDKSGMSGSYLADGVVLTGNGAPRTVALDPGIPNGRVFDAETFWPARAAFLGSKRLEVAVAGDGGSAGTIAAWLADRFRETESRIISISPTGTLFPRGDGYAERRWFTDPSDWPQLSEEHRRNLIKRTEAGVVSLRNKRGIDRSGRIFYETGEVEAVAYDPLGHMLDLKIRYGTALKPLSADFLINAIGFEPWSRLALVDHPQARVLAGPAPPSKMKALGEARLALELAIGGDLALPTSSGLPANLHVPSLAAFAQGPGFGNLGCLGLMARKILDRYLI